MSVVRHAPMGAPDRLAGAGGTTSRQCRVANARLPYTDRRRSLEGEGDHDVYPVAEMVRGPAWAEPKLDNQEERQ